jgi:hypothetical protein
MYYKMLKENVRKTVKKVNTASTMKHWGGDRCGRVEKA